jgi:hypothetical protein
MGEIPARHDVMAPAAVASGPSRLSRAVAKILTIPISLYRTWISPMSGPTCRFYPSCSHYAVTALSVHGAGKGSLLAIGRICRCHPWTPGGVDAVPAVGRWRSEPYVREELRVGVESDATPTTPAMQARSAE